MTLRRFLDISYSLIVDEYQRLGMNLVDALEKVREFASSENQVAPVSAEAAQNDRSLQELEKMMKGLA